MSLEKLEKFDAKINAYRKLISYATLPWSIHVEINNGDLKLEATASANSFTEACEAVWTKLAPVLDCQPQVFLPGTMIEAKPSIKDDGIPF